MSKLLDALDAALDAFQATGPTTDEADPSGLDPQTSSTVPLGATVAPAVAPMKAAENRPFSTGATRATANHKIQDQEAHASNKTDVLLHREAGVARSYPFQVAPVAPVEKLRKSACFTGATVGATDVSSGTTADFCGSWPSGGACETSPGALEPSQSHFGAAEPVDDLSPDLQAIFDERAAIAEFDGGLRRDLAEDVARAEVAAGPVGDDPAAWLVWMRSRIAVWQARGWSDAEVSQIVWSEAESTWHRRHGAQPDPDRCAGCGRRMLDVPGMSLLDGAVVHVGFDCLIAYGVQWRQAASDALVSLLEEQAAIAEFVGGQARAAAERQAWTEMIGKPNGAAR